MKKTENSITVILSCCFDLPPRGRNATWRARSTGAVVSPQSHPAPCGCNGPWKGAVSSGQRTLRSILCTYG